MSVLALAFAVALAAAPVQGEGLIEIADTDGDGCSDVAEYSLDARIGGQRDPDNPWDYFNPTNDGQNRIDDVLAVINNYRADNPPATDPYDRTGLEPNEWNLGLPNGQILIDDVLAAIYQYRHDCAGPVTVG
jgi:hypothetical protein